MRRLFLALRSWTALHSFIVRVVLGATFTAIGTVIGLGWPEGWPSWIRNVTLAVVAFCAVVLIELARDQRGRHVQISEPAPAPRGSHPDQAPVVAPSQAAVAEADERPVPKPEVVEPLPPHAGFRGRSADLAQLHRLHRERRLEAHPHGAASTRGGRPVLVFIHGKAGLGKSALAQELARQLSTDYPDGQLYANLGNAGDALSAGETLKTFLDALGWAGTIPANQADRVKILRTLTAGKKYLFILDAARNYRQVFDVLPSDSQCAAIVTSRRDISSGIGIPSHELGLLEPDDALEMLYAVARTKPLVDLECAVETIEHCGRLPLAIRSAGERVSLEGSSICEVALALRAENTRLYWLTRQGIVIREGFDTEYGTLDAAEQTAFRLLGQIGSDTFVPLVLCPMVEVGFNEAEDLCARLNRAQLIDFVSQDRVTGVVRYQMHPLVRLFARERVDEEGHGDEAARAIQRLDAASDALVRAVVDHIDGRAPDPVVSALGAEALQIASFMARNPDEWARLEYVNAVRALDDAAVHGDRDLCWRIASRLGGIIPPDDSASTVERTFAAAIAAVTDTADPLAGIDVHIAYASSLIALERYTESDAALVEAERRAGLVPTNGNRPGATIRLRQGKLILKRGEAFLQMRRPSEAEREFQLATPVFGELAAQAESRLVRILEALNVDFNYEDPYDEVIGEFGDSYGFWAILERFEERRRARAWSDAEAYLDVAAARAIGDTRKQANLLYRRGKLHLLHWEALVPDPARSSGDEELQLLTTKAAYRAAEAMRAFERMGNVVGEIRAGCLLSRALVAAGLLAEALQQIEFADQKLRRLPASSKLAEQPLTGRLLFAKAIAGRAADDTRTAQTHLLAAVNIFNDLDDGRSRRAAAEVLALPDPVRRTSVPPPRSAREDTSP